MHTVPFCTFARFAHQNPSSNSEPANCRFAPRFLAMANLNSQLASVNKIVGYAPGDGSCMHWSYLIASGQTPMFDDSPFGLDDANSLHRIQQVTALRTAIVAKMLEPDFRQTKLRNEPDYWDGPIVSGAAVPPLFSRSLALTSRAFMLLCLVPRAGRATRLNDGAAVFPPFKAAVAERHLGLNEYAGCPQIAALAAVEQVDFVVVTVAAGEFDSNGVSATLYSCDPLAPLVQVVPWAELRERILEPPAGMPPVFVIVHNGRSDLGGHFAPAVSEPSASRRLSTPLAPHESSPPPLADAPLRLRRRVLAQGDLDAEDVSAQQTVARQGGEAEARAEGLASSAVRRPQAIGEGAAAAATRRCRRHSTRLQQGRHQSAVPPAQLAPAP